MAFTPMEEVQRSSVVPQVMVEKEAKDFFREEWVEEPEVIMLLEGLEEVVVLMGLAEAGEAVGATLGVVAGKTFVAPVEEEEDHTTLEKISRMNAVTIQLDMVR